MERKEINRIKEKIRLTRRLGVGENMLATSVTGVATILGLTEKGVVTYGDNRPQTADDTLWIYGTTDFANPVETIMVATAKAGREDPSIYLTDSNAHTVASYAERVLIPSLVSLYELPAHEANRLSQRVRELPAWHDIELEVLQRHFGSRALDEYFGSLRERIWLSRPTFFELYNQLNKTFCEQLRITYYEAEDFFAETNLRVRDIVREAFAVANAVRNQTPAIEAKLNQTIDEGLSQLGYNTRSAAQAAAELRDEFFEHVLGGRVWNLRTRKFFRRNTGDEESIGIEQLDQSAKLADLSHQGIVLGGNAWVLAMQLIKDKLPNINQVIIAHKNTRSGANYTLPLLAAERTRTYVSSVVRVVPNGQQALRGDGLDIGAYILHPILVDHLRTAFAVSEAEVIGGKRKVVIEVHGHFASISAYSEPADSNNLKARKLLVLETDP